MQDVFIHVHPTDSITASLFLVRRACSAESKEGFCEHLDTSCSAINTCKTCDTFAGMGGECTEIDYYPNATISEHGTYSILTSPQDIAHKIKAEIYSRGPVATGVNAEPLVKYEGGIVTDTKVWHMMVNHIVSIVGWVSPFFLTCFAPILFLNAYECACRGLMKKQVKNIG